MPKKRPSRSRLATDYQYKRTYKACIPCRQRKVKCELDTARHHQPCTRCRKLDLECRFTAKQPWSRERAEALEDAPELSMQKQVNKQQDTSENQSLHSVISSGEGHLHPEQEPANGISTSVLQKKVTSGHDALDILFDAAVQERGLPTPSTITSIDTTPNPTDDSEDAVLKTWEGCRFVKGGWFTAKDAVLLMDLFFENMAPASPILSDFFAAHNTHYWLITQEPVLCCTMLMISARYHTLPGPSGASRGFMLHHKLWQHCQHLILRVILGQEKHSKAKTRHLGTIEALLLLTEWYPRALHLPPENDGWDSDLMYTAPCVRDPPASTEECPMQERWKQDVVEPTRRLDRMSWMLASSALALAHELGVFDSRKQFYCDTALRGNDTSGGLKVESYIQHLEFRRKRLPALLYVVLNLLSSRIGCPSIMHEKYKPVTLDGLSTIDPQWTKFMTSWVDLTVISQIAGEKLLIGDNDNNRRNIDLDQLEELKAKLTTWKENHQQTGNLHYDNTLHIEYEYLRVFANSLGVHRIVERVLTSNTTLSSVPKTLDATFISQARQINMTRNEYDFIEEVIDGSDAILSQVISLSQPQHSPQQTNKQKQLQYLPIRIFLRIISSSVFLLKALSLGVRMAKLHESLRLLDQAILVLQSGGWDDDFHLIAQYATLLEIHVSRLRQTFASSSRLEKEREVECRNEGLDQEEGTRDINTIDQPVPVGEETSATSTWDPSMIDWANQIDHPGDWLSLPLDSLMAPFGSWDGGLATDLDSGVLDLDFIWNLPP